MPENRIEKRCIEKNMKMTEQRRVIARVLSVSKDHPDVEEVHRRSIKKSKSTFWGIRKLKTLTISWIKTDLSG